MGARAHHHDRRPRSPMMLRVAVAVVVAASLASACGTGSSGEVVMNLFNAPQQNLAAIVDRCNEQAGGRYRIQLNVLPRGADGQREQLVRRLAAGDSGLDVLGLDVTWTAELAEAGWIREWTGDHKRQAEQGTLAGPLETATWRGRLYAAPYNTNVQLLWYRADLIDQPPSTWDGLIAQAARLAAAGRPHYVEVTGAQYEGLVVWFNSLVASAGGQILNDDGTAVVLGPPALRALQVMKAFATSPAADPSLSNTQEDQARLAVEGGRAAAEINWPFVYAAMASNHPEMLQSFRWAPYPGIDGPGTSPLGGANFAVSSYSLHPDQAHQAALCLRDPQSQLTAAVKDGLPPTIRSVYDDPAMAEAYPMRDAILDALKTPSLRPKSPVYQNVSTTISAVLSPPQSINPPGALRTLTEEISAALESRGVLP
jgi:multiple sugar transport system substrate-binding protein